jgi:uncharacterized membrane protein YtjA (UPF0391 family)
MWLVILFAILTILFGAWGFAVGAAWAGARILFWIFLALFIVSWLTLGAGWPMGGGRRERPLS